MERWNPVSVATAWRCHAKGRPNHNKSIVFDAKKFHHTTSSGDATKIPPTGHCRTSFATVIVIINWWMVVEKAWESFHASARQLWQQTLIWLQKSVYIFQWNSWQAQNGPRKIAERFADRHGILVCETGFRPTANENIHRDELQLRLPSRLNQMEIWLLPHQLSPDNRRHRKWIKRHVYAQNQTITPGRLPKLFWQRALNQSADIIQLLQRHTSLAGHRKLNMTQRLLQSDLDSEQIRWSGLTPDLVPHLLKGPLTTSAKYKFGCRRNGSKCQLEWFAFILLPLCTILHQLRALQPPNTSAL